jgi:hypothetical protein
MNNEIKTGVYTIDDKDTPFAFYTSLNAYRKSQFVVSVCNTLVGDNYNYVLDDLVFDYFIVAIFTDIDVSEVQKSDNGISAMEEFVEKFKPVIDTVKENAVDGVLDELRKAIDLNIEYRTGIHINPISSSIASFIDTIERKVDGIDLNSMMDLAQSMASISDELTADKLLDAYAKTDVFKKHWGNSYKDDIVEDSGFSVVGGSYDATSDTKGATAPTSPVTK